jgi:CubicO group peptidase (beta-lactamase class C family)
MRSRLSIETTKKLEDMIASAMTQTHIPGLSLALVKNNRVVYARGFGSRNFRDNLPATQHTLYGVGSCTKSFTALAIMQLAQDEKLDIHDSADKYIPLRLGSRENPITIRHLLAHSSGIPSLGNAEAVTYRMLGYDEKWIPMGSMDDIFLYINGAADEVIDKPGRRFFYLNEGYTLLGEIVARVSKMRYEEYIKEKILRPLKMNRSGFTKEDFEKESDVMIPYGIVEDADGRVTVATAEHPFHMSIYAAGGLLSSVREMSNYVIANLNCGVFDGTSILEVSLLREMHKIQIGTNTFSDFYGIAGKSGYGYGWGVTESFLGHKLLAHSGSTGVSSSFIAMVPDLKIGVVEAANSGQIPGPVLLGVLVLMMGKDPIKEIPFFDVDRKLNMLVGVYATYRGILRIAVVRKGAYLFLEPKDRTSTLELGMSVPLIPENERLESLRFYMMPAPGAKTSVEFLVEPSGKVELYVERYRFHKVEG